jgi:lipid II isoglutaminyl synthase (glutamine-hydrolysing)
VGRAARWVLRLRGGGSAVPGRIVLMIAPRFLERAVSRLPLGLVFVSGSNGKSTTTNMLSGMLRAHGLSVFTNPSGGNLPQGIASAMLASVPADGFVRGDVGVVEVDEAYGVALAERLKPNVVLLLNIQIDQLNRFFEPARVVEMLRKVGQAARDLLVVNADDDNLRAIGIDRAASAGTTASFEVAQDLIDRSPHGLANVRSFETAAQAALPPSRVRVTALDELEATVTIDGSPLVLPLPARGLHYAVDAAGALATALELLGDRFSPEKAAQAMTQLRTVYGRGETITVNGEDIEIIMMKNPPSLQLNLDYLASAPSQVLMAVDEGTPDPSWIYDTDFHALDHVDVVSGTKAWQLATRLGYAHIPVGAVRPELKDALAAFLALPRPEAGIKTMIVNYEQMMFIRKQLGFLDLEGGS